MTSSGRILGWTFGAAGILAAAALAFWLLGGDDEPAPDGDQGTLVSRPSQPRDARKPMSLDAPPDRPGPPTPEHETSAPVVGAVAGRVTTADRRVMKEGRVEALRGALASVPGLVELTPLHVGADVAADGRFTLDGLPPVDDLVLRMHGETFALTDAGNFVVQPGQTTDLGDVIVSTGMDVIGRVADERGRPVAGAHVGLFLRNRAGQPPGDEEPPSRRVLADPDGRFRFPHAPIDSFSLTITADGYANAMAHGGVFPGEHPPSVSVLVTMRKVRPLRGRVVGLADGKPIGGALVRAVPLDLELGGGSGRTDADGRFELTDVAYGNYNVEAIAAGYSVGRDRTWTDRDDFDIEIALHKQGSLKGIVVSENGDPVTSFDLQPQFHQNRLSPAVPRGAFRRIVDKNGAFELEGLEPGFTCVQVWAKGYALTEGECIRVRRGEDVEGVVVTLVRGAVLEGIALDDRGQPVAGASVALHRNKESDIPLLRGTSGRPAYLKDTRTGPDGRFVMRELTGMTYQVEVDHPDFAIVRRNDVVVAPSREQEIEPFVLDRAARVEGVAVAPNGQLQSNAVVYLQSVGGSSRQTSTDGHGRFVFPRLAPGDYQLACHGKTMSLAAALRATTNPPEPFHVQAGQTITRNVISFE